MLFSCGGSVQLWPSEDFGLFMGLLNSILQVIIPLIIMLYVYIHMTCVLRRKRVAPALPADATHGQCFCTLSWVCGQQGKVAVRFVHKPKGFSL